MEKINKEKNNSNYISVVAIILILFIIGYFIYMLYKNNNALNSNQIKSNIASLNENTNVSNNSNDENIIAQKEIKYEEVEVATYTSTLYDNEENRIFNIQKACSMLNGITIKAGEEFSFNNTIGPMGEENGFKKATGFDDDGTLIQISGGGMCQVSSTLYNVALLANLEITERHAHSRRVNYVPADKDATILYPSLDLKFINNTSTDLKIYAETDNYSVTIKMTKMEQSN